MIKKEKHSQTEFADCLGYSILFLTNIPICLLRGMSYKDTRKELQKMAILAKSIQSNFTKNIVAYSFRGEQPPRP